jgi:hypothetical protein
MRPKTRLAFVLALPVAVGCKQKPAPTRDASAPEVGASAKAVGEAKPAAASEPLPRRWSFDDVTADALPAGWTAATGAWAAAEHGALRQVAESPPRVFNVLLTDTRARDFTLRVRIRALSGKIDQGGGVVWRASDADNYYVARFNPLEKNFRAYTMKRGTRSELASAEVNLPGDEWHTLEVRMVRDHIEGSIDGRKYLDLRDTTFPEAGAIGLWTKADAVTDFDDLELRALGRRLDTEAISSAVGTDARVTPDGVVRVSWPRTDVKVAVDRMPLPPEAGLTSWAAFAAHGAGAMLMGDTVVFEDEATAAMDAAFSANLEVTALHNHFFFDRPNVYFMHLGGHGDPVQLARGVRKVWDAVRAVRRRTAEPTDTFGGDTPKPGRLDATTLSKVVGHPAETKDGVTKITVAREGVMRGARVGGSMGLTTWAAFSGSDTLAAVDGDVILTEAEVQPVLRALRKANLHVVALHNHMVGGEPFYYFTHFWGKGPAAELARGFRSVLDAQAASR